jgi:hypothetical protein
VGLGSDGSQHSQSLGGHLNTALPKEVSRVWSQADRLSQILD